MPRRSTTSALPVGAAAAVLGVSLPTLRRWIDDGAPVVRRGRRGRGKTTLVDPAAVQAWRMPNTASPLHGVGAAIAGRALEASANATAELHRSLTGPFKVEAAQVSVAVWYVVAVAFLDELRAHDATVEELSVLPHPIARLKLITG